jgi:hypothetical protein
MTPPLPFETYQAALERVAKAVIVFSADWIDPTKGIHALWADKRRVHGLVIGMDAEVPFGFRVETQLGELRAIVPDLTTVAGREIQAQLDRTCKPTELGYALTVADA